MALSASTLYKIGGAQPGLFIYTSADAIATVIASGYFNAVTDTLKANDVILAVTSVGGTLAVDALVVSSATGAATVTTTNGT
jgi:hypothetical protein